MNHTLNLEAPKEEAIMITRIARRAYGLLSQPSSVDTINLAMSLTAAHLHGCRLDLDRLYNSVTGDLLHDVIGIHNNVNHTTGMLENDFWPRHAAGAKRAHSRRSS